MKTKKLFIVFSVLILLVVLLVPVLADDVQNTDVDNPDMSSFFISISSWVHDNTLLPLDIAERLVTIIFLTVFYLVVVRLPMYFLYMRDKEGRIRGKWVDVFYFCFCVSYMCAPLWIGVFNL